MLLVSVGFAIDLKDGIAIVTDSKTQSLVGKDIYNKGIEALQIALDENFVMFDTITSEDVSNGALNYYEAVILLAQSAMQDKEVELYKEYIEAGGYVIATYNTSLMEPNGNLREDLALADLLKVSIDSSLPKKPLKTSFNLDFFNNLTDAEAPTKEALIVKAFDGESLASFKSISVLNESFPAIIKTDSTAYIAENVYMKETPKVYTEALLEILTAFLGDIEGGFFRLTVDDIKGPIDEAKAWYKTIERDFKVAQRNYEVIPEDAMKAYEDSQKVYGALKFAESKNAGEKAGTYLYTLKDLTNQMIPGILQTRGAEARAVWIDYQSFEASKTEEDFRDIVRKLAKANINMIFPETIYSGATLFRSEVGEQKKIYQDLPFDPLEVVIDEAHKLGIEVHPWVWVFCGGYWGEFGPTLQKHPEWVELDERGQPFSNWEYQTAWYNASHPEVRAYLLELYNELITKYDVDGLHVDYIRYNEDGISHFGYSDYSKEAFFNATGLKLDEIRVGSQEWIRFNTWRENNVTTFVEQIRKMLDETNSTLLLSAAVVPDPENSRRDVMQNWKHWLDNGYLDFVMTMDYRNDTAGFKGNAKKGLALIEDKAWVYPGLGLYVNDRFNNIGQIKSTREVGSTGVALFSNISFWKEKYDDAVSGLFKNTSVMPMREPFKAAVILLDEAADKYHRASLDDLSKATVSLRDEVASWDENLENAIQLREKTITLLAAIEQLKADRVIRSSEVETLSSSLVSVSRIANIYIFQNSEKEYVPPTPRTN